MAVKVKSALALYQKFNVTRSTICVESFILVSKSAHKASFLALYTALLSSNHMIKIIIASTPMAGYRCGEMNTEIALLYQHSKKL